MTGTRPRPGPDAPAEACTEAPTGGAAEARTGGAAEAASSIRLVHTGAELRALAGQARRAVVMTMGALHEGHAALIRAARTRVGTGGQVVVTVFVNPLQFGPGEDLDRYPRTLEADVELAASAGADLVFAPSLDEVYPGGEVRVRVAAGAMGERFEGASRPGHFDGMLTVVAKLLHLTAPDLALYGQKDAQQLALIQRMVRDLNFPVEIVGVPTVREPDGLALSSRNRYLSAPERKTALALSRALFAAEDAVKGTARDVRDAGPRRSVPAEGVSAQRAVAERAVAERAVVERALAGRALAERALAAARAVLDPAARLDPPLALDYLALIDPAEFTGIAAGEQDAPELTAPAPDFTGDETVLAVAARVGATRLIDNIRLPVGGPR